MANYITFLRIVLVLPAVFSILQEQFTLAVLLTLLSALTDLLDGRIARRSGESGGLGKLLDPLADKLFTLSVLVALVDVGRVGSIPVILLILREFSVSFLRDVSASQGSLFGASNLGKVKTTVMFAAIVLIMADVGIGKVLLWVSVAIAYISFYDYVRSYIKAGSGLNYP